MNRIRLPLLVFGILSSSQWPMGVRVVTADGQATRAHTLVLDVAADCRTFAPTTARGETNMVTGKIFPGGTLPSGMVSNDPVLPVNGVAPIGDWHHRSQNVLPLPADIADAYGSAPGVLATFYFFFNDGRGKSEVLFEGPYAPEDPARLARSYAVAPDGRRFPMMKEEVRRRDEADASQIVVIRNWAEELKRLVPAGR